MAKKRILISFLGTTLDQGFSQRRLKKWRPSVAICMHKNFKIDEYYIIYRENFNSLLKVIVNDINQLSPEIKLIPYKMSFDDPWDFEEVFGNLYDFSKQFKFDTENYEYFFHITTGTHVIQICIFLLTESRHFPVKLIQSSPVYEGERDIKGGYSIIDLDLSRYDNIAKRFEKEIKDDISFLKTGIKTKNKEFNSLIEMIEKVAIRSKDPILLMGPTGAGKSHLANRIYLLKKIHNQISGKFVEVNCATLRGDAAMSALFGHKKGSFTGALNDRQGLLKESNCGILFLDEIGELGLDEQAMLLRAIEEKKFLPLGSDIEVSSDFQLICGTNKELYKLVEKNEFRDDLYARIYLWTFSLPGLKDRIEDIEPNVEYELFKYENKENCHISFNKEAKEYYIKFAKSNIAVWKANFRDLNASIIRMATLSDNGRITIDIVKQEINRLKILWENSYEKINESILNKYMNKDSYNSIDPFDKIQLLEVIKVCRNSNSLSDAGRKLFSISRKFKRKINDADRLKKYLEKFNLTWDELKKN